MPAAQTAPARKTLEYQLGRLDSILDGLSNALQESVTTAVQNGVTEAVREAVRHTLQEELATSRYLPVNRLEDVLRDQASPNNNGRIHQVLVHLRRRTTLILLGAQRLTGLMWTRRWQMLLASSVGLAVGGACYLVSPLLGLILLDMLVTGITLACICPNASDPRTVSTVATHPTEVHEPGPSLNGTH